MNPERSGAEDGHNPLEDLLRQLGMMHSDGTMPSPEELMSHVQAQLQQHSSRLGGMFGADSADAVSEEAIRNTARAAAAQIGPDPSPSDQQQYQTREAIDLAAQWLTDHTTFPPLEGTPQAWSRAEWVEATVPAWTRICEPVISHLVDAVSGLIQTGDVSADLQLGAMMRPLLRRSAAMMFTGQLGQALGQVSAQVLTGSDLGLPITSGKHTCLLPHALTSFGTELELPEQDLRVYLALREVARRRLFASVAWLEPQLLALVEHYAREIVIDRSALETAMYEGMSDTSPESLQTMMITLNSTLFEPAKTPEQKEVLERLQTLLALVEGWVDDVVSHVGQTWLTSFGQLTEALRRRRALDNPSAAILKQLVGLEMQPKLERSAAELWGKIRTQDGISARDELWRHPDLVPTAAHLADPASFFSADAPQDEMDIALRQLLEGDNNPERGDDGR